MPWTPTAASRLSPPPRPPMELNEELLGVLLGLSIFSSRPAHCSVQACAELEGPPLASNGRGTEATGTEATTRVVVSSRGLAPLSVCRADILGTQ